MKKLLGILLLAGCQRSTNASSAPSATTTPSTPSGTVSASASASAAASAAPSASVPDLGGQGFGNGHCPCGCDHSKDMVDELRLRDRATAIAAIDESLRTIGEREDAGFITERMVEHRLRLVSFGREIGRTGLHGSRRFHRCARSVCPPRTVPCACTPI